LFVFLLYQQAGGLAYNHDQPSCSQLSLAGENVRRYPSRILTIYLSMSRRRVLAIVRHSYAWNGELCMIAGPGYLANLLN